MLLRTFKDVRPGRDGRSLKNEEDRTMTKLDYEHPECEALELGAMLDVCNDPSNVNSTTDPLNPKPGSGWDDGFDS